VVDGLPLPVFYMIYHNGVNYTKKINSDTYGCVMFYSAIKRNVKFPYT